MAKGEEYTKAEQQWIAETKDRLMRRKALQQWLLVLERQEREVASPRPLPRHLDEDWEKVADW